MLKRDFINLSNGIEALDDWVGHGLNIDYTSFIRIQSTWCEQKRWDDILFTLSDDFLMCLALGYYCVVYDCTVNEDCRAIWQGIEWIKFVLNKVWFNKDYKPTGRCKSSYKYFCEEYKKLSKQTLKKIKYFKKFLLTDKLMLQCYVFQIKKEKPPRYFRELLRNAIKESEILKRKWD